MMEKFTLDELRKSEDWKNAVIVFKPESFNRDYTEESRSYEVDSSEKFFNPSMIGSSLYGNCLDGKDNGVRLDVYMSEEKGWIVDYCYKIK